MGNHRAARRAPRPDSSAPSAPSSAHRSSAGKRRAVTHAAPRTSLFRGLPSSSLLLGVAALAVSAGGAITMGESTVLDSQPDQFSFATQASALSGAGAVASVGADSARGDQASRSAARSGPSAANADAATADVQLKAAVEQKAEERTAALSDLTQAAEKQAAKIKLNLWQLPVAGYHLTATFGEYSGLWSHFHTGLDFAAPTGTPIHAIANGVVTSASYDGSYGNKTVVTLEDGTELWYCHQNAFGVSVGETVDAGALIGYIGSTGNVTGPHLHLEVRPGAGDPVDPYAALVAHGVTP